MNILYMARKKRRSRRRKGGQGQGNNNRTSKILARAPSIRRRMGEAVKGNAGTSKILAKAPSIRRRMGEAQGAKSPAAAAEQQDNPNYDERGQNEVDRGWVNVATQEDDELGHITDPNIGKRKWFDPRGWVGMGGKRRRRRKTRRRRRSRRRRRRRRRRRGGRPDPMAFAPQFLRDHQFSQAIRDIHRALGVPGQGPPTTCPCPNCKPPPSPADILGHDGGRRKRRKTRRKTRRRRRRRRRQRGGFDPIPKFRYKPKVFLNASAPKEAPIPPKPWW